MKRRLWMQGVCAAFSPLMAKEANKPALTVSLDSHDPARSVGVLESGETFSVGFGRDGFLLEGSTFVGGSSLLGDFFVNAILSPEHFEMTDRLVASSGKSRTWLEEYLFANMSSIDFDGDGKGGEYGKAFIGLEPVDSTIEQPFHFGEYKGVFRWYSYAIHGTQDEARIGKCITGGCINVGREPLVGLLSKIRLGDLVRIVSSP